MSDSFYGARPEQPKDTESQLLGGVVDLPIPRHTFWEKQIQTNQKLVNPMSCTLHGNAGAISDLTNYAFSTDELKTELAQARLQNPPFSDTDGWYINSATDLLRKYYNLIHSADTLRSFGVPLCSQEFWDGINKGYTFVVGYSGNKDYNLDHQDGILNEVGNKNPTTYGHCVRVVKSNIDGFVQVIVDNYFVAGGTQNTYQIPKDHLKLLVANKVFFATSYVFAFASDFAPMVVVVSPWAIASVEKAKKHGILDWTNPQQECDLGLINTINQRIGLPAFPSTFTPALVEISLNCMGILTSITGTLTKERYIVALDRLSKLN